MAFHFDRKLIIPGAYLVLIAFGMFMAIPVTRDNEGAVTAMQLLTIPWGLVSTFVIMFGKHQGFENVLAFLWFALGGLSNTALLYHATRKWL